MPKIKRLKPATLVYSVLLASLSLSGSMPITRAQAGAGDAASLPAPHELLSRTATAFNDIAQKATPAVVSISVIKGAEARGGGHHGLPFGGPSGSDEARSLGIGSGVFIRSDGYILTNNHVVENAEKITVTLDEKHKTPAQLIGTDPKTDLAVIRVKTDRKDFPVLGFGDSQKIKVGDWAVAIGSPFGLNRSVTSGIVSAKGRAQMGILDTEDFIQTDAAINPGSSGGPLLNLQGEMIGINTAIFSQGSGFVGIGFAIPAQIAREISDQIIDHGKVQRGWIGLAAQDLDTELAGYFGAPNDQGALVSDVVNGGPASRATIRAGDVVLTVDGQRITNASDLKAKVGASRSNRDLPMEIVQNGRKKTVQVHVAEQPRERTASVQRAGRVAKAQPSWGLGVEDVPDEIAGLLGRRGNSSGALVVSVEPGSPAFEAGLSPGDVILRLDKSEVPNARTFANLAHRQATDDKTSVLYVQRGPDERLFVPLKSAS